MAGLLPDFNDEPRGLLGGLRNTMMDPMFLAGAGLLTGQGFGGAMRGAQLGMSFQDQQRQEAERRRKQQGFESLLGQGGYTPEQRGLLQMAGPEEAMPVLLRGAFPEPMKPTDDQREYAMARAQGFDGSFLDFLKNVKSFGAPQTTVNMPPMEKEYDKTMGGELAKEFVTANRTAATAQRDIASLNAMRQALEDPNLYTGTGANVIQGLKKGAETLFGVPVKGTSSGEIMQSIGAELALSNREKLPGPMSNADREFLERMPANITKTPEGNRLLIELGLEDKRWQIARAQAARDYAARNGGRLDSGFYAAVGQIDADYARKSADLVRRLRGLGEMAPRAPTVGTGLNPGVYNWSPNGGFQEAK